MTQAHPARADQPGAATSPHAEAPVRPHRRSLPLRVGTRASPLALVQTRDFLSTLKHFCPVLRGMDVFEEHAIHTTGDAVQDRKLAEIGGKGLFAKEIHEALADGRVDFAVHSLKDLETDLPPGIVLACTLRREDARDALIPGPDCGAIDPRNPYAGLPQGAVVGTASVRRQAQMLHARPDLQFQLLRGNVQRRLDRVARGDFSATLLALAGLRRLGLDGQGAVAIDPEVMVPAACQGIVGITVRDSDVELRQMLSGIEDPVANVIATAERALLAELDGSCRTPIGGHAVVLPGGEIRLTGLVASVDGSFLLKRSETGAAADAARLGRDLGASLRMDSPRDIFV
jgi:hydroxymethylbilane synthase